MIEEDGLDKLVFGDQLQSVFGWTGASSARRSSSKRSAQWPPAIPKLFCPSFGFCFGAMAWPHASPRRPGSASSRRVRRHSPTRDVGAALTLAMLDDTASTLFGTGS